MKCHLSDLCNRLCISLENKSSRLKFDHEEQETLERLPGCVCQQVRVQRSDDLVKPQRFLEEAHRSYVYATRHLPSLSICSHSFIKRQPKQWRPFQELSHRLTILASAEHQNTLRAKNEICCLVLITSLHHPYSHSPLPAHHVSPLSPVIGRSGRGARAARTATQTDFKQAASEGV